MTPLIKHKIVKKRKATFKKYQSDRYKRIANVRARRRELRHAREKILSAFTGDRERGRASRRRRATLRVTVEQTLGQGRGG